MSKNIEVKALSERKRKKVIRNVLSLPFKDYWPLAADEDAEVLKKTLLSELPQFKLKKFKPLWREMKNMNKSQRQEKTKEFFNSIPRNEVESQQKVLNLRRNIFFGVNSLSRGLEKNRVASCLVAEEATPQSLVMHIIHLAKASNTPTVVVKDLKEITQKSLGFQCLALGVAKNLKDMCGLNEMHKLIQRIYSSYLENHESHSAAVSDCPMDIDEAIESLPDLSLETVPATPVLDNIILYRTSKDRRVFVPGTESEESASDSNDHVWRLDLIHEIDDEPPCKKEKLYQPPSVLRVQNNPSKLTKKKKKKKKQKKT